MSRRAQRGPTFTFQKADGARKVEWLLQSSWPRTDTREPSRPESPYPAWRRRRRLAPSSFMREQGIPDKSSPVAVGCSTSPRLLRALKKPCGRPMGPRSSSASKVSIFAAILDVPSRSCTLTSSRTVSWREDIDHGARIGTKGKRERATGKKRQNSRAIAPERGYWRSDGKHQHARARGPSRHGRGNG